MSLTCRSTLMMRAFGAMPVQLHCLHESSDSAPETPVQHHDAAQCCSAPVIARRMSAPNTPPFAGLNPDAIIKAVESVGIACDGRVLALNSYENRVYRLGREEAA